MSSSSSSPAFEEEVEIAPGIYLSKFKGPATTSTTSTVPEKRRAPTTITTTTLGYDPTSDLSRAAEPVNMFTQTTTQTTTTTNDNEDEDEDLDEESRLAAELAAEGVIDMTKRSVTDMDSGAYSQAEILRRQNPRGDVYIARNDDGHGQKSAAENASSAKDNQGTGAREGEVDGSLKDTELLTLEELHSVEKSITELEKQLQFNPNDETIRDCIYENMRILDANLSKYRQLRAQRIQAKEHTGDMSNGVML